MLLEEDKTPTLTVHDFFQGKGIYLGGYEVTPENTRMLTNLILLGAGEAFEQAYGTDNVHTECAYYPGAGILAVINNSGSRQHTGVYTENGNIDMMLEPYEMKVVKQ